MFHLMLPRTSSSGHAPRRVDRDLEQRFGRAYRMAWEIREFTGSSDPRPLVAALTTHGITEAEHRDLLDAAVRTWRRGVESEVRAWRRVASHAGAADGVWASPVWP
ncbi:hypothetical protein [Nocardioides sp. Leaf307]|uniref:hypothetical protein n=1 Tax=Nocardioides sp. Leaf307 TaxID=1736331 RepID=UPI000702421F|nr:hypothetical protein [Nocardioides sp. Leaf307]KQQ42937.1 hypothetical protein ASF50_02680 [Nocardioides sp. Leaf307]